jgi:site-specific recombinase XerD
VSELSSSNHPISRTSPPHPSGAVCYKWGLRRGLTKVYNGIVNIFTNRLSLGDALARYADWLATTRRFVARSKREYRDDVSDLVAYLETRCKLRSPVSVRRQHLEGFLAHCVTLRHAPGTRRRSVAAIRSFFAFLVANGVLRASPAEYLLPPERAGRPPRVLTEREYTRLRHTSPEEEVHIPVTLVTEMLPPCILRHASVSYRNST